jgi:hypothetical protein
MKIRELVEEWPLSGWSCEGVSDSKEPMLDIDVGALRLAGYTGPDSRGWFTLTGRDLEGREWSTSFQVEEAAARSELEQVLADTIRTSLVDIGEIEVFAARR